MTLRERLSEYIRAAFTGIWIESHEHEDALAEISQLCGQEQWRLAVWDLEQGLRTGGSVGTDATDPLAAIRAAASLLPPTRYEAESAFSLSLVREAKVTAETLWELKSQMLKKSGLLQLHRGSERFDDLGGLEVLKAFCRRVMRPRPAAASPVRGRGIMLLSPPGCGKSAFAKSLGNETGRPTLVLDVGSLMGSLVGQSESNIRQALQIIDAMAPAVLFIDECEKALSGVASSGQTDSGVSARLFGTLLTWLNDHTSDVFVVCTCNDISKLPPEFSRAERFDGVFFVDLPDAQQRQAIWQIYIAQFALDSRQQLPADDSFTGAEIKSCCRLAALLDVPLKAAAQNVVPVSDLYRKITLPDTVRRIWTQHLTSEERIQVARSRSLGPNIVDIWCGLRNVTGERAIVDLARLGCFLLPDEGDFLLRACGQTGSQPASSDRPIPRLVDDKLMLDDRILRRVKLGSEPTKVELLIRAFEESNWAHSIPTPFDAEIDPQYVHQAVKLANQNLVGIRFAVQRGGQEVAWYYTTCQ